MCNWRRENSDRTISTNVSRIGLLIGAVLLMIEPSDSWPSYRFSIPNGKLVPNPCEPNSVWTAVGHGNPKVYAPRNPFGEDFLRFGLVSSYIVHILTRSLFNVI